MPMGGRNARYSPMSHVHRVTGAYLRKSYHVHLDDIIV